MLLQCRMQGKEFGCPKKKRKRDKRKRRQENYDER